MAYQEELRAKLNNQANDIIKDMPVFARKFFIEMKNKKRSARTIQQYAYDIRQFFAFLESSAGFKNIDMKALPASEILDKLTVDDYYEYLASFENYEIKDKYGNVTSMEASDAFVARRISSLRSFYRYYAKIGEIKSNLADLMETPAFSDKKIITMDKDQVKRILAAVTDHTGMTEGKIKRHSKVEQRDFAIMMLFFGTGLRVSELVGINLEDVDFVQASIWVQRKGGDADIVFFGPEVEDALAVYLDESRDTLLAGIESDAFFISMKHNRMAVRSIEEMIQTYALKAGLNIKITPHALRRSFATNLYNETGDIYLVADALHHSSVDTTKKHYAKVSEERKRLAAKEASSLFKDD